AARLWLTAPAARSRRLLADLQNNEDHIFRKVKLRVNKVQGKNCLTNFYSLLQSRPSTRRSKLVSNINYAPDFITAIENSASKLASCYGFLTTASLHKIYSLDPNFKHSRDIIDQFAADRANSFDYPNLSAS
ncbi:hypothetical protein PENANT_c369G00508, partial [Penicillium antarcticum]